MKKIDIGSFKESDAAVRNREKTSEMQSEAHGGATEAGYFCRYNGTDIKISFSGRQSFESCLWAAVTGSGENVK